MEWLNGGECTWRLCKKRCATWKDGGWGCCLHGWWSSKDGSPGVEKNQWAATDWGGSVTSKLEADREEIEGMKSQVMTCLIPHKWGMKHLHLRDPQRRGVWLGLSGQWARLRGSVLGVPSCTWSSGKGAVGVERQDKWKDSHTTAKRGQRKLAWRVWLATKFTKNWPQLSSGDWGEVLGLALLELRHLANGTLSLHVNRLVWSPWNCYYSLFLTYKDDNVIWST